MNDDTNNLTTLATGGGLLGLSRLLQSARVRDYLERKAIESEFNDTISKKLGTNLDEYNKLFNSIIPSEKPLPLTLDSSVPSRIGFSIDRNYNFIPKDPNNSINIRVKTGIWDPVGRQSLDKPVNMATLAHEIGHYKNYLKDKKSLLLKLDNIARNGIRRPNISAGLGVGGGLYVGSKALGASDETALVASGIGGGLLGIAHDAPLLTNEALASINGIKGLIKYNKTAMNKVPIRSVISNLSKAYSTYLREPAARASKLAGLGLLAGAGINLYKNLLKE